MECTLQTPRIICGTMMIHKLNIAAWMELRVTAQIYGLPV